MTAETTHQDPQDLTGTSDSSYNIMWFTQACLDNVVRLETYCRDAKKAGDDELVDFFERAKHDSRKGAEEGKRLLSSRLG